MKSKSYREMKMNNKRHHAELAERRPDAKAVERFHDPPYQAARMIQVQGIQAEFKGVRWIDLVDYMLQNVGDGSIKLSDRVPADVLDRISGGHMGVTEYMASKYNIYRGY